MTCTKLFQKSIDENFLSTFDIMLLAGRNLTKIDLFVYDQEAPILINEVMSQKLGPRLFCREPLAIELCLSYFPGMGCICRTADHFTDYLYLHCGFYLLHTATANPTDSLRQE